MVFADQIPVRSLSSTFIYWGFSHGTSHPRWGVAVAEVTNDTPSQYIDALQTSQQACGRPKGALLKTDYRGGTA